MRMVVANPPGKEVMVCRGSYELLLKASKGVLALAVEQRHVHAEEAQQRVGFVFHSCRIALRRPRHLLRNAGTPGIKDDEVCLADTGDGRNLPSKTPFGADLGPATVVKFYLPRCHEFLERPSSRIPPAGDPI